MRSIRRLIASVLTACALLGVAATADAAGPPTIPQQSQPRYYVVYYREGPSSPWYQYGWTTDYNTAAYHTNVLRSWGYDAYFR